LLNLTAAVPKALCTAQSVLPTAMTDVPTSMRHRSGIHPETVITTALLCGTLVVGFATLRDYGIALDEWNADEYGVKHSPGILAASTIEGCSTTLKRRFGITAPGFRF
jgi:hypothetical protein